MRRTLAAVGSALLIGAMLTSVSTASAAGAPDPAPAAVSAASRALQQHGSAIQATGGEAYAVYSSKTDASGAAHVRYTRTYHGLRVYGGDFVVHTAPGGAYAGVSNGLRAPLTMSTTPKVSAAGAATTARRAFAGTITGLGGSELFVDASSGLGRLAWETTVNGWAPDGQTPSRLHVITDATTGALIGSFDEIESVLGTGHSIYSGTVSIDTTYSAPLYYMIDPSHGNNRTCDMGNSTGSCVTFTDSDNVWGNGAVSDRASAGVDAHFGAAKTYDYFKLIHGRCGIGGACAGVPSRVHYGNNYINAFWDGTQMTYGDGAGNARPLVALDVAGHEMAHGVTAALVSGGLTYSGESGGLNEATSDIFGNMVEFYANVAADPGDYLVGEKIDIFGTGAPLRYMYNPGLDGVSHTCWSSSTPSVDPHYSSGVGNHFFFNLAVGTGATPYGTSPICGSAPAVVGIGRAKAEKIWYRALDVYFTSSTRYVNTATPSNTARAYTLAAAADLYGLCSVEYKTVHAAWTAVNVVGTDPCAAPTAGSLLWLRADLGVVTSAGTVTTWNDQSGTGHHASMPTVTRQPTLVAGALNGKPVVRFGGAQSLNLVTVSPTTFTMFIVGKNSKPTETYSMILGPGGSNPNNQLRWANGGQVLVHGSGNGLPTTTSTIGNTRVYHALSLRYDGSVLRIYRDGALVSSHTFTTTGPWSLNSIGAYYSSAYMTGDLAEVLVYSSALSEADRTNTNTYLKTKYALP